MNRWWRLPYVACKHFPEVAGCYAIYRGRTLLYVGSTINLRERMRQHRTHRKLKGVGAYSVKFKPSARLGDSLMLEARLLHRLNPEWNVLGVLSQYRPLRGKPSGRPPRADVDVPTIRDLRQRGASWREIGRRLNLPVTTAVERFRSSEAGRGI